MDRHNILSLLGLSLRGGNLSVGEEPVETAAQEKDARIIFLASDAADNTKRRAALFAETGQCLLLQLPFTRAELGKAVGRASAALLAVTDIGLANALGQRLAELDPDRYGEAAGRLALKNRRAMERRVERKAERQTRAKQEKQARRVQKKEPGAGPAEKRPPREEREKMPLSHRGGAGNRSSPAGPRRAPAEQRKTGSAEKRGKRGAGSSGRTGKPGKSGTPGRSARSPGSFRPYPYAHSRPVKKGKGSFRKREDN